MTVLGPVQNDWQSRDAGRLTSRAVVIIAAFCLAYIGLTCPCKPNLISCHLGEMYAAIAVIIGVLVANNGLRIRSYRPGSDS